MPPPLIMGGIGYPNKKVLNSFPLYDMFDDMPPPERGGGEIR